MLTLPKLRQVKSTANRRAATKLDSVCHYTNVAQTFSTPNSSLCEPKYDVANTVIAYKTLQQFDFKLSMLPRRKQLFIFAFNLANMAASHYIVKKPEQRQRLDEASAKHFTACQAHLLSCKDKPNFYSQLPYKYQLQQFETHLVILTSGRHYVLTLSSSTAVLCSDTYAYTLFAAGIYIYNALNPQFLTQYMQLRGTHAATYSQ